MTLPTPFGRYLLTDKIAAGGMAEIFKAKLVGVEGFEKTLVIKRILPFWSERRDFVTMLVDEAKVLVHLNHPNIVQVYELGRVGSTYFIAMELVDGFDLKKLTTKIKKSDLSLPQDIAITIILDSLLGLQYAHERSLPDKGFLGIVHRDISPQNILLSMNGEVKVTDFGIAKAITQTHETQTGVLKGKIAYMSPEQALGRSLDFRSDLFSTGIVLYELLFNERLFATKTDVETLDKVRSAEIPWPEASTARLYPGVKEVLSKALALNPKDRFGSAEEFAEALEDCLPKGRRVNQKKMANFFKEIFSQEIKEKRRFQKQLEMAPEPPTRQTLVAQGEMEQTISLVEPPTELELPKTEPDFPPREVLGSPRPPGPPPGMAATKSKGPRSLPILLIVLWIGLAITLTYIITGQFRKDAEETPVAAKETPKEAPVLPKTPTPAPSPTPAPVLGSLHVSTKPQQAALTVEYGDKKDKGIGKVDIKELAVGTKVKVIASLKGYDTTSRKFTITPEKLDLQESITLKKKVPQFGSIRVNASPWGKVYMGRYIGGTATPAGRSKIPVGGHRVTVKNEDLGKTATGTARIRAGRLTTCTVNWNANRVGCR